MKKIRMFCDPLTASMGVVWFLIAMPFCSIALIDATLIYDKNGVDTVWDIIIVAVFYLLDIGLYVLSIKCSFEWFARAELNQEGICLIKYYKRSEPIPYKELYGFQIAYYRHIYAPRYFVVIGRKPVSQAELSKINTVRSSEDRIKIKLSKKRYKLLCKILPDWQAAKLKDAWKNGTASKSVFDPEKFKRIQYRKQKSKKTKR